MSSAIPHAVLTTIAPEDRRAKTPEILVRGYLSLQASPAPAVPAPDHQDLGQKGLAVFGEATRSGNRVGLVRRIAWGIQAKAEGDLSERARKRADEPDAVTIELWSYASTLFADDGGVDRLSLYLSLRDTDDERVQAALEDAQGDLVIKGLEVFREHFKELIPDTDSGIWHCDHIE